MGTKNKKLIKNISLSALSVILVSGITYATINFPTAAPAGETAGGEFMSYFNKLKTSCGSGEYLEGFDTSLNKKCKPLADTRPEIENVPLSMCYAITSGLCEDGSYMKGPGTCCPFKNNFLPGVWYDTPKMNFQVYQNDPDGYWSDTVSRSFVSEQTISDMQVWGYTDDGGYCYVWWGNDHVVAGRNLGSGTRSNPNDGTWYPYDITDNDGYITQTVGCPAGNGSFDDNGNASACALTYNAGSIQGVTKSSLNIPAGTTIHMDGRHAIGQKSDFIECHIQVKYK